MGESSIFTCTGHLFTVDPVTKANWIPLSKKSVDVNFYLDPVRKCYRIVSVGENEDVKKVVLNCLLKPKMVFKKTSQKFGQWTDISNKSIYGIGFSSENELNLFIEKFKACVNELKNSVNEHDGNNNLQPILTKSMQSGSSDENAPKAKPLNQHIRKLEDDLAAARLQADSLSRNGKLVQNNNHISPNAIGLNGSSNQISLTTDSFPPPPMRPLIDQLNSQSPGNSTHGSSIISTSSNENVQNLIMLNRRLGSILQEAVELQTEISRILISQTSITNGHGA